MGKKTKKIARKKKESNDVEPEDYAWLLNKSSMAAMDKQGSSSNQVPVNEKTKQVQICGAVCSNSAEVSSPSVSCSLGGENSVNGKVVRTVVQHLAVQENDELPEPVQTVRLQPVATKTDYQGW